ncbi:hypothetical protein NPIL_249971, partial [Nephila pilipes]
DPDTPDMDKPSGSIDFRGMWINACISVRNVWPWKNHIYIPALGGGMEEIDMERLLDAETNGANTKGQKGKEIVQYKKQ